MKDVTIRFVVAVVVAACMVTRGFADDTEPVEMQEVVVTGTRNEQKIKKIPANVTVIDQQDIKNSTARTVVELLRGLQGLIVRDLSGNGKNASVDMRGFGENAAANSLIMIDGRRVNEIDLSGVDWLQIPLDQVERLEIVRGTGSVLWGDNAVGGVINIITKLPSEKISAQAGTFFGSYGHQKQQASLSGSQGPIGAALFASYDSTNGYRENSGLRARDIGGKIFYDMTDIVTFRLNGSYHTDTYGMPGALTEAEKRDNRRDSTRPRDDAQTRDGYLSLGMDTDFQQRGRFSSEISYRSRSTDAQFPDWAFKTDSEIDTWGFTPRYTLDSELAGHANTLIIGTDLYWADQDSAAFSFGPSSRAGVDRNSLGVYVSNEFSLLENVILSTGARRERVRYDLKARDLTGWLAPLNDDVSETENAYSLGLTWLYSGNSSLFARANRSFRFPLTDEFVLYDFSSGTQFVNPNLKPQTGRHYEIGARHYFTDFIQGSLTLFRAEINNELFYNPETFENANYPKTHRQGIELGLKADFFDALTLTGNYTFQKSEFRKGIYKNNDIPAAPEHAASLGVQVRNVVPGYVFSAFYNYVGSSYLISDQANSLRKLDDYGTLDAKVSYTFRGIEAFFCLNNLTNEKYSEYAVASRDFLGNPIRNFYPAPERNWWMGISYKL
ncbi:MAG: TonB-dependent receptor [Deltaproteobacteria bacterium]|nr:TonB-dependent receptor [Deltaproteobacteria bacterium]